MDIEGFGRDCMSISFRNECFFFGKNSLTCSFKDLNPNRIGINEQTLIILGGGS